MLETAHAAMRPWPLFSHESFGHVLMLDSYMHACDLSMGTIELHDPTCCFMSVWKLLLSHASVHACARSVLKQTPFLPVVVHHSSGDYFCHGIGSLFVSSYMEDFHSAVFNVLTHPKLGDV